MIVPTLARLIIRENLYKPIRGRVLCLGRQTIAMTYQQAVDLMFEEGVPGIDAYAHGVPVGAKDQDTRRGKGTDYINDTLFFRMMGITDLHNLDVSTYEGADIIHNLNQPVPESLCGQFDFIIDDVEDIMNRL